MNGTMLRSLEERLRPEHTALLVIDVQNDFCHLEGGLARRGGDVSRLAALLGPISALMAEAQATGVLVVCLRIVGSGATDSDAWAALSAGAEHELVAEGSWGAEYVEGLPVELADLELVKRRHSAFVGTGLDDELRRRGIRTVVLAGGVTNVCVEGTAREAADRDYYVVVLSDATAAVRDDLHEMTLTNVSRYLGWVCGRDEATAIWRSAAQTTGPGTEPDQFDNETKGAKV